MGIRKTPLTVKNLTSSTPFSSSSYYYTGATTTTLTLLDIVTGAAGYMTPTSTTLEVKMRKYSSNAINAKTGIEEVLLLLLLLKFIFPVVQYVACGCESGNP